MSKLQEMIGCINKTSEKDYKDKLLKEFVTGLLNEEFVISVSQWYEDKDYMTPFIGLHEDAIPSLYVFTSPELALNFAEENEMVSVEGGCLAFKVLSANLVQLAEAYNNGSEVEGLVIDQGANAIYISFRELLELLD
jgi:hypothetical protein